MDTVLAQPLTPPPLLPLPPPPSLPHATQVAGGLGLSLTAANYRLTRPRCALHDCLAPRSGYPELGRDREGWRERWLGRTEKDRDALKRATRAQKQRAERSEGTAGHLSVQLLDVVGLCHINLYSLDLLVRVTLDTGMLHFYNRC